MTSLFNNLNARNSMTIPGINYHVEDSPNGLKVTATYVKRRHLYRGRDGNPRSQQEIESKLHHMIAEDIYHQPRKLVIEAQLALQEVQRDAPMLPADALEKLKMSLGKLQDMLTNHVSAEARWFYGC